MAKINTILIDFDGTLMDTTKVILNSWEHTFLSLGEKTVPEQELMKTFGEPLTTTIEKFWPDKPIEPIVEIYREYHYANFGDLIVPFPGMIELVKELAGKSYKLAVVTSRMRGTTELGLRQFSLERFFDEVITFEDTTKHKPDAEPIEYALKKLNVTKENAIMLGDSSFDIISARNAGVKSVLVGWTEAISVKMLNGADSPNYLIKEPRDIFEILQ